MQERGVGRGGERALRHAGHPVHGPRPGRGIVRVAARLPPQQPCAVRGHARRDGALQLHEAVAKERGIPSVVSSMPPIVWRRRSRSPDTFRSASVGCAATAPVHATEALSHRRHDDLGTPPDRRREHPHGHPHRRPPRVPARRARSPGSAHPPGRQPAHPAAHHRAAAGGASPAEGPRRHRAGGPAAGQRRPRPRRHRGQRADLPARGRRLPGHAGPRRPRRHRGAGRHVGGLPHRRAPSAGPAEDLGRDRDRVVPLQPVASAAGSRRSSRSSTARTTSAPRPASSGCPSNRRSDRVEHPGARLRRRQAAYRCGSGPGGQGRRLAPGPVPTAGPPAPREAGRDGRAPVMWSSVAG